MKADRGLAVIAWHQGEYALSHKHLSSWRSEAEILHDERNVALALGVMGLVYNEEGKKSEAMDCNERYLSMSESRGDKRGISTAIGNIGSVYWSLGQDDEAMECYKKQLAITESIGDKSTMGIAIGNIGLVHHAQGRYDEAIHCYQRKLELSDSIGDKLGVSFAIGNLGLLYFDQGHHSKAIVHHEHKLRIAESLGDKRGMSRATGNMGYVYFERLQFEDALISFRAAIEGHTAMGYRNELPLWHLGISLALLELGSMEADRPDYVIEHLSEHTKEEWRSAAYFAARENAEEGIRISRELSRFDTAFSGKIILTRIDAAEGKPELATQKLSDMLNQTNDEAEKAELHYWLWKIDGGKSSAEEAYRSYATLSERTPKFEYLKRIAELKGERIPKSADDIVPT
jgi:tetratricopeptide (TPR) repeat protein